MSHKNVPIYDHRLSANISQQMNSRLDTLADIRNQAKSELVREAVRFWLDHQEDTRMSRQFFTKSFQRRVDHLDWQFEVVMQMLSYIGIIIARTFAGEGGQEGLDRERFLHDAIQQALKAKWGDDLTNLSLARAAQNRKPPTE